MLEKKLTMKFLSLISVSAGISLLLFLSGCITKPKHIKAVTNFEISKYAGKWYEIARLDHRFEKGVSHVSAEYNQEANGSIKVVNRGIKTISGEKIEAHGIAKLMEGEHVGYLKVSFFRPFYGAYVVFELGPDYEYAYVTSNNKKYLWLLARTPSVSEDVKINFVESVERLGFDTKKLIWVNQVSDDGKNVS